MALISKKVRVYEQHTLPEIFPEEWINYGNRTVTATSRAGLTTAAKRVWEEEPENHHATHILLDEIRKEGKRYVGVSYSLAIEFREPKSPNKT